METVLVQIASAANKNDKHTEDMYTRDQAINEEKEDTNQVRRIVGC